MAGWVEEVTKGDGVFVLVKTLRTSIWQIERSCLLNCLEWLPLSL